MKKSALYIAFSLLFIAWVPLQSASGQGKTSIVGKWRVISDDKNDIKNHTYEFSNKGICIEKYRSWYVGGSIDEPPQSVEMDAIITYQYKFLGKNRYRLQEIKSLIGGKPSEFGATWCILNVTTSKNKAKVYTMETGTVASPKDFPAVVAPIVGSSKKKIVREESLWVKATS